MFRDTFFSIRWINQYRRRFFYWTTVYRFLSFFFSKSGEKVSSSREIVRFLRHRGVQRGFLNLFILHFTRSAICSNRRGIIWIFKIKLKKLLYIYKIGYIYIFETVNYFDVILIYIYYFCYSNCWMYIKYNNSYIVSATEKNANVSLVFVLLNWYKWFEIIFLITYELIHTPCNLTLLSNATRIQNYIYKLSWLQIIINLHI